MKTNDIRKQPWRESGCGRIFASVALFQAISRPGGKTAEISAFVQGCSGLSTISAAGPNSTRRPRRKRSGQGKGQRQANIEVVWFGLGDDDINVKRVNNNKIQ
jgi:hypothetical protein